MCSRRRLLVAWPSSYSFMALATTSADTARPSAEGRARGGAAGQALCSSVVSLPLAVSCTRPAGRSGSRGPGGNSVQIMFRNSFQTCEDKANAINENTGVNERLVEMIMKWHCPGKIMAVGKPEYKKFIEERLGVPCLYGPIVMELMWGIQRLMPHSVPEEKSQLTEEDRLPLSQGLQKFLSRYDCDVKPEMVNDKIIEMAAYLFFKCDSIEKYSSVDLRKAADHIKNISGVNCEDWSLLKIATALKIICRPEETDNSGEMIPSDVVSELVSDAPIYEMVLDQDSCLRMYSDMMNVHKVRIEIKKWLKSLIKEAKEAYEAEQAEDHVVYDRTSI